MQGWGVKIRGETKYGSTGAGGALGETRMKGLKKETRGVTVKKDLALDQGRTSVSRDV